MSGEKIFLMTILFIPVLILIGFWVNDKIDTYCKSKKYIIYVPGKGFYSGKKDGVIQYTDRGRYYIKDEYDLLLHAEIIRLTELSGRNLDLPQKIENEIRRKLEERNRC